MKIYKANITDASGNISKLKITINERKQQGIMEWPMESSNLVKLRVTETCDRIQGWVKWPSFNLRCIISTDQLQGKCEIHIQIASRIVTYFISQEDHSSFLEFIRNLALPVDEKNEKLTEKIDIAVEFEKAFDQIKINVTHMSLFVGWRIGSEIDMEFVNITSNGLSVDPSNCYDIEGQGFYIPMGFFKKKINLLIAWRFRTNYVHMPAKIILGVFRNGSLRNRTILEKIDLNLFDTYSGSSAVVV